jgi:hypothetical protein
MDCDSYTVEHHVGYGSFYNGDFGCGVSNLYISKFVYDADMFELNTNFGPLCKECENKSNSLEGFQKTFEIIYNWI